MAKDLITQFQAFITENQLFKEDARILLAVSAGVDSVVLCHVFYQAKLNFGIAHCNFKLRGIAADEDEVFVAKLAQGLAVPFFSTSFDTQTYARKHKLSIQMAARELRYGWLEAIRHEFGFQYIATAHHLNDSIETFFYNFAKGTGIRGLQGIPIKNGNIIRPLIFSTKQNILDFAHANHILFREDTSNQEDKYARNKIRHRVLPVLQDLNPNFEQTAQKNLEHIRQALHLYDFAIDQLQQHIVTKTESEMRIDVQGLSAYQSFAKTLLYEWLRPMGFQPRQIGQMLQAGTGAYFYSDSHYLLVDRTHFIIEKRRVEPSEKRFVIPFEAKALHLSIGNFTIEHKNGQPKTFTNDPFTVFLDAEKLHFPLTLRHWKKGDYFYPLGLNGRQKLQDFFTNLKIPRLQKARIWILESGGEICWIMGYRLDERFKITTETQQYIVIKFENT